MPAMINPSDQNIPTPMSAGHTQSPCQSSNAGNIINSGRAGKCNNAPHKPILSKPMPAAIGNASIENLVLKDSDRQ